MPGQKGIGAVAVMNEHDADAIQITTERYERRLAEECGTVRVDMANEFGKLRVQMAEDSGQVRADMERGFGEIRVEMRDRNADLLKWALVFGAAQTAAIAAVVTLFR
jgi:hypothetical protein